MDSGKSELPVSFTTEPTVYSTPATLSLVTESEPWSRTSAPPPVYPNRSSPGTEPTVSVPSQSSLWVAPEAATA